MSAAPTPPAALTPVDLRAFVDRYCQTVSNRDTDAYVALYAADAVQTDPANSPSNVGHDAIRAFFERTVAASHETHFEAQSTHTCGNQVAIHFKVAVTLDSGRMTIEGIEVFTLDQNGLIASTVAYWDDTSLTFG